jgi:hypothetical protein
MLVVSFVFRVGRLLPPSGSRILDRRNTVRAGAGHLGPDIRQDCAEIADHPRERGQASKRVDRRSHADQVRRTRRTISHNAKPWLLRAVKVLGARTMLTKKLRSPYVISPVTRFVANRAHCEKQPRCRLLGRNAMCTGLRERIDTMLVFETRLGRQASDGIARSFEEGAEKLGVCAGGKFAFQIRTCSSCEDEVWGRHHISTIGPHTHKREIQLAHRS